MTNTPDQAIAYARSQVASGAVRPVGNCLGSVRDDYWGPGSHAYGGTAYQAYLATKVRGAGPAPAGALHFWSGGSTGAGHITLGLDATNCISTDFGPNGYIGDGRERIVPIASIAANDTLLTYVGWTRDLDGEVVVPEGEEMLVLKDHIHPLADGRPSLWVSYGDGGRVPLSYSAFQLLAGAGITIVTKDVQKTGEPLYALLQAPVLSPGGMTAPAGATATHKHNVAVPSAVLATSQPVG